MLSTGDFKGGMRIELDGELVVIIDVASQSPTARGLNTLIKTKLRNLITGQFIAKTFKSGEKFNEPDLEQKTVTYLYKDGEAYYFMDTTTFEQYSLGSDEVGDNAHYLVGDLELRVQIYNERPIGVEVPPTLVLTIVDCEPAVRGDTVNAVTKAATLETGFQLQVPMFIENGEKVKVDTREGRYISRAK